MFNCWQLKMRMHKCSECKKNFRHKANRDIHLDGCGPSEQSMDAAADVAGKLLVTDILKLTDEQQQAVEQFKIAFVSILQQVQSIEVLIISSNGFFASIRPA